MGIRVKFNDGADPGSLELQKEEFLKKYLEPEEADRTNFHFQSIKDMHFESGHLSKDEQKK